ncbi:MAG: hypothetical protein K6F65_06145, partial [Lachnospiraceae bacterium]|nr:hypothetical protein [Lachnospiraceae bacterium]
MPSEIKETKKEKAASEKPAKEKAVKKKAAGEKSEKDKKRNRDREVTIILSAILAVLTIAGLILFFIMPDPYADIPDTEAVTDIPEPAQVPEPDNEPIVIPVQPPIVYPAPAYDFIEEEVYIE